MSTVALVALVGIAFAVGAAVGMLVTAACAAGSREDAFRRGYLRGLHSGRRKKCRDHEEVTR